MSSFLYIIKKLQKALHVALSRMTDNNAENITTKL